MKSPVHLILAVSISLLPVFGSAETREWTRASDGKKITADFVGMKGDDTVQIKMANGKVFDIPLSSLSTADNEYIASLSAASEEKVMEKTAEGKRPADKTSLPEGETTVTLSGVAIFCGDCVKRIEGLKDDEEYKIDPVVEVSASRSDSTITVTAPSGKLALAAVRQIQSAGYYGDSDVPGIEMTHLKKDDFASDTMVVREAAVICRGGVRAFEKAIKGVDGVDEVEAKEGSTRIKITGEAVKTYDVLSALREAGFGGRIQ